METGAASESGWGTPIEVVLTNGERLLAAGVSAELLRTVLGVLRRMIHLPASVRVYLCLTACDMRQSFDGLHALNRLEIDPFGGHLCVSRTAVETG